LILHNQARREFSKLSVIGRRGGSPDDDELLTDWPEAVFERCTMFVRAAHHPHWRDVCGHRGAERARAVEALPPPPEGQCVFASPTFQ
jgi:hypothetical protein